MQNTNNELRVFLEATDKARGLPTQTRQITEGISESMGRYWDVETEGEHALLTSERFYDVDFPEGFRARTLDSVEAIRQAGLTG